MVDPFLETLKSKSWPTEPDPQPFNDLVQEARFESLAKRKARSTGPVKNKHEKTRLHIKLH
jgi:hypothetical protein